MTTTRHNHIEIQMPRISTSGFTALLGQGVAIDVPLGVPLDELLSIHFGFGNDYVHHRIQTIFVNGKAVDREQEAMVADGDIIALSAAMPGLVGATLRKAGFLSDMRSAISQSRMISEGDQGRGRITLKLFNLIADEMGPLILSRGVWITGPQMIDTLTGMPLPDPPETVVFRYNDNITDSGQLRDTIDPDREVFLRVTFPKQFPSVDPNVA